MYNTSKRERNLIEDVCFTMSHQNLSTGRIHIKVLTTLSVLFLHLLVSCGKIQKHQLGETLIWYYQLIIHQILSKKPLQLEVKQNTMWKVLSLLLFSKFKFFKVHNQHLNLCSGVKINSSVISPVRLWIVPWKTRNERKNSAVVSTRFESNRHGMDIKVNSIFMYYIFLI